MSKQGGPLQEPFPTEITAGEKGNALTMLKHISCHLCILLFHNVIPERVVAPKVPHKSGALETSCSSDPPGNLVLRLELVLWIRV